MSLVYFLIGAGVLGLITAYSQMDDGSKSELPPQIAHHSELCLSLLQKGNAGTVPPELKNHPQLIACEKIKKLNQAQLRDIFDKFMAQPDTQLKLENVLQKLREVSQEKASTEPTSEKEAASEKEAVSEKKAASESPSVTTPKMIDPSSNSSSSDIGDQAAEKARQRLQEIAQKKKKEAEEAQLKAEAAIQSAREAEEAASSAVESNEEWLSVDHSWGSASSVDSSMTGYSDMS